jgi:hypothetical protein
MSEESFPPTPSQAQDGPLKQKRVTNACDACRARKVKCHYEGQSTCTNCRAAEIPCTAVQPRKKRGPRNKYVEAQKQALLDLALAQDESRFLERVIEAGQETTNSHTSAPALSTRDYDTHQRQQSGTLEAPLSYLDLAPFAVIEQILHDWFEFVHPVAPILHRDGFLREFHDSISAPSSEFSALVISICSATVATLRQRAAAYEELVTVEKCFGLAQRHGFLQNSFSVSLRTAQIKYNCAVSIGQVRGMDCLEAQSLLSEATSATGRLLHYEVDQMPIRDRELLKRLYLLCFAGQWYVEH